MKYTGKTISTLACTLTLASGIVAGSAAESFADCPHWGACAYPPDSRICFNTVRTPPGGGRPLPFCDLPGNGWPPSPASPPEGFPPPPPPPHEPPLPGPYCGSGQVSVRICTETLCPDSAYGDYGQAWGGNSGFIEGGMYLVEQDKYGNPINCKVCYRVCRP